MPRKAHLSNFVEPMQALAAELKFDGYRAQAIRDGAVVRLLSRNGLELGHRFPALCKVLSHALPTHRESVRRWGFNSAPLHLSASEHAGLIRRARGWPWNGYELLKMKTAGLYPPERLRSATKQGREEQKRP